uniref:Uncharacterized protein n=1 Tax=Candidatus Kentrum sp. DK TaxID=2126562 RepID=A0A450TC87_9GAMM|nr:MAG: Protein of unknown function (DUF560) [Candidatus Kentron sp. DK]
MAKAFPSSLPRPAFFPFSAALRACLFALRGALFAARGAAVLAAILVIFPLQANEYNTDAVLEGGGMDSAPLEERFNQALRESETGDLKLAIKAFQRILAARPEADRVKMELALAYMRSYDYARAEAIAREVLTRPTTPAGVKIRIREFLAAIETRRKPHKFTPYLSLGMKYDDNVNAGPQLDEFNGLVLSDDAKPREDTAITLMGGISHSFQTGKTIGIGDRIAAVLWQSGASLYHNDYSSENDYDLAIASVNTGPTLAVARGWRANLDARVDNIHLGNEHLADYVAINPSVALNVAGGKGNFAVDAKWQHRDFKREVDADRDADHLSTGAKLRYYLTTRTRVDVSGRLFDEKADIGRHSKDGYQLDVGVRTHPQGMTRRTTLYGYYSYKDSKHDAAEPIANVARDEAYQRVGIGIRHGFEKDSNHLKGWVMNASYTHVANDSNVVLYGYDRNQVGISMQRRF